MKIIRFYAYLILFLIACEGSLHLVSMASNAWHRAFSQEIHLYVPGGSTAASIIDFPASFPELVANAFGEKVNGKTLKVTSLAADGEPLSYSYRDFLVHFLTQAKPGVMLVYAGINDIAQANDQLRYFNQWKFCTRFYLCEFFLWVREKTLRSESVITPQTFEHRLAQIVRLAKRNGIHVVLFNLISNEVDFDPSIEKSELNRKSLRWYKKIRPPQAGLTKQDYALLEQDISDGVTVHPYFYYLVGKYHQADNRMKKAKGFFRKAINSEASNRNARWKGEAIIRVSKQEKTAFVNTYRLLKEKAKPEGAGMDFFWDAHHPRLQGYQIIVNESIRELNEHWQLANEKQAKQYSLDSLLAFRDKQFSAETTAYFDQAQWYIAEAQNTEMRAERIARAENFLKMQEELAPQAIAPEVIRFWRAILLVMKREYDGAIEVFQDMQAKGLKLDLSYWDATTKFSHFLDYSYPHGETQQAKIR